MTTKTPSAPNPLRWRVVTDDTRCDLYPWDNKPCNGGGFGPSMTFGHYCDLPAGHHGPCVCGACNAPGGDQ